MKNPVRKQEHVGSSKNEIVVYQPNETIRLEVQLSNETVWLTIRQMCELFGRDRTVVTKHLNNAIREGELDAGINVQNLHLNQKGRPQSIYDLDAIIAVGYRVKSPQGVDFRRWATQVLKSYLLRGMAIQSRMDQFEAHVDRRLSQYDRAIGDLEEKVEFFVRTKLPPVQGIFYDGQVFDARVFATRLMCSAQKKIVLVDNWIDVSTLDILAKKSPDVALEIVTSARGNKLSASDVDLFRAQYGEFSLRTSESFHDRFLILDGTELYLIGASLKDLGRKCFAFTKLDPGEIPELLSRIEMPRRDRAPENGLNL